MKRRIDVALFLNAGEQNGCACIGAARMWSVMKFARPEGLHPSEEKFGENSDADPRERRVSQPSNLQRHSGADTGETNPYRGRTV